MEQSSFVVKKEFLFRIIKLVRPIDVVVVLTSIIAMYLFRLQDGFQLNPIWQLKRHSGGQLVTQVHPLIADLDGNGLKEFIIASEDKIELFSYHADEFDDERGDKTRKKDSMASSVLFHLHLKAELGYSKIHGKDIAKYPVAMNSGCTSLSHNDVCPQVLAIVWSDWSVTLLSHQLKILWSSKPMSIAFDAKLQITEMSILVASGNRSVFGENGLVIVGGVLNLKDHKTSGSAKHDHAQRSETNKTAVEISWERAGVDPARRNGHSFSHDLNPTLAKYVGHFTSYALDGGSGELRWKHEPGDFEIKHEDEEQASVHFKLRLRKKASHQGEVHWKKYRQSFLNHLPYSWAHNSDTKISLGEFQRSSAFRPKKVDVNIAEQFMALAKTGIPVLNEKDTRDLNAVVIHHSHGIEVLSLDKGSPMCSLLLDARHSTLADVNGDEKIDLVKLHVYEENSKTDCSLVVSDALVTSSVLFNSSVCNPQQIGDFFGGGTSTLSKGNIKIYHLPPLLTKTVQRSSGILQHVLGHGLTRHHVGMDTFVLTSLGKLSSFEPSGRFLWQVHTGLTWSETHKHHTFMPSMKAIPLTLDETQDGVMILGSHELMVVSLLDGSIFSTHSLPCIPTQPLVLGDINNDVSDEFLVGCKDRYIAFSLERYNRTGLTLLVYSGIACLVAFLLFVIKFIEREEFPYDTLEHVSKSMRLFPLQGTKL